MAVCHEIWRSRCLTRTLRTTCAASFAVFANHAFAADVSPALPVKASAIGYDWTGFYLGG
jgi:hypothetical protein